MKFLLAVAALFPFASSLAFPGPAVTPVIVEPHPQGWTPAPTPAPYFKELVRRQTQSSLSLIEGPDFLCGYQNGNSSDGIGLCGDTDHCGFATAAGEIGDVWCFGTATSSIRQTWSSCVYSDEASSCASDAACSDNPGILQCTDSVYSVCNVGTFVGLGVEAVWCDTTAVADEILISTTYPGQVGRSFTAVGGVTTTSTSSTSTSSTSTSTPLSTTPPPSTPTPIIPGKSSTPTPTPSPKKSTPIGPIVGGVVGGVALIAGFAVAMFFCLRREKKTSPAPASEVQSSPNNNIYPPVAPVHYNEKPTATTQVNYSEVPQQQYPQQYAPQQTQQYGPQPTEQYPIHQSPPQQYQQQYPQPPVSPVQSQHPSQTLQQPMHSGRDSIVSAISSPSSPAPPYVSTVPSVPEVANTEVNPSKTQSSHISGPVNDRYEMQ